MKNMFVKRGEKKSIYSDTAIFLKATLQQQIMKSYDKFKYAESFLPSTCGEI